MSLSLKSRTLCALAVAGTLAIAPLAQAADTGSSNLQLTPGAAPSGNAAPAKPANITTIKRIDGWMLAKRDIPNREHQYFITTPQANDPGKNSTFFTLICIPSQPDQLMLLLESKTGFSNPEVNFKVQLGEKDSRGGKLKLSKFSDKDPNLHAILPASSPMLTDLKRSDPYFAFGYAGKDGKPEEVHAFASKGSTAAITSLLSTCKKG
ncbi:hypothetical protein ACKC9G_17015 [Pokkaliibacter sp. CJK22405]|uniref:hypothetical protein n=1 Tax=Pokkaliibacter sp. CJK22405 TaxID=3384615 RepID=UPI003984CCF9